MAKYILLVTATVTGEIVVEADSLEAIDLEKIDGAKALNKVWTREGYYDGEYAVHFGDYPRIIEDDPEYVAVEADVILDQHGNEVN